MSDLAATNCGCGCDTNNTACGCGCGSNSNILWILILLCCCGGHSGCGNNCGCGGSCGSGFDNSCIWIILLLLLLIRKIQKAGGRWSCPPFSVRSPGSGFSFVFPVHPLLRLFLRLPGLFSISASHPFFPVPLKVFIDLVNAVSIYNKSV